MREGVGIIAVHDGVLRVRGIRIKIVGLVSLLSVKLSLWGWSIVTRTRVGA